MQKNTFYSESETTHDDDDTLSESENDNLIDFHSLSIIFLKNANLRSFYLHLYTDLIIQFIFSLI